jgi:hypothetical protein
MLARHNVEARRLPPTLQHHVSALFASVGHVAREDVRQSLQHQLDLCVDSVRLGLQKVHLDAEGDRLRLQRLRLAALALGAANVPRQFVALRLLLLQQPERRPAAGVERQDRLALAAEPPPRHGGVEASGVAADGADVVHGYASSSSLGSTRRTEKIEIS